MSLRRRLLLACGLLIIVPLVGFALGVRYELQERFRAQFGLRVNVVMQDVERDLDETFGELRSDLTALKTTMRDDNRLRLALQGDAAERSYLLDFASEVMPLVGLDVLQIQMLAGRIVSSGHYRNEFDRVDATLYQSMSPLGPVLLRARSPAGPLLVLATADTFELGDHVLVLIAGLDAATNLTPSVSATDAITTRLLLDEPPPDSIALLSDANGTLRTIALDFVDIATDTVAHARSALFVVEHDEGALRELLVRFDLWLVGSVGVTLFAAIVVATFVAARLSRPVQSLADRTSKLDLDRLDIAFERGRTDEVGVLEGVLAQLTDRLRTSREILREAERRSAVGDMARQVNHDIKNGLIPVRNVFRHLVDVSEADDSAQLRRVFVERRENIEAGLAYLENLATNYAKLSPNVDHAPVDLRAILADLSSQPRWSQNISLRVNVDPNLPDVAGEATMLRRIVENIVGNAADAVSAQAKGEVVIRAAPDGAGHVMMTIHDNGPGMTKTEVDRAFQDFYTTKPQGTGLGLSVVRRLVQDLGGSMRVETAPKQGTTFALRLPTKGRR